jgi:hypothetical protein
VVVVALTVGELVAYATIDKTGFGSGTRGIAADLKSLQSSTSSTMQSMEGTVTRSLADIERAIADGLDPAEAIRDLDRLEDSLDQSLRDMEADADRFAAELEAALDAAFDDVDLELDSSAAHAEIETVKAALADLGRQDVDVTVDVDTRQAVAEVAKVKQKADELGPAFQDSVSVLGKAGPPNVALIIAAIKVLPAVASVAASGVVLAFGGALAAIGITAATGADRVRHAWSELGDDIKAELGDAARPLEDSLIRAADKARDVFDDLDFEGAFAAMAPGVDAFVDGLAEGVSELNDLMVPLGERFGTLLSELGDRMPEIMANVEEMISIFMAMMDEDPQMLANLIEDATALLAVGAEVLAWADDLNAALDVVLGNPKTLLDKLELNPFIEQAKAVPSALMAAEEALAAAGEASRKLGDGAGEAEDGVRNLSAALEEFFDPAAKALDAEIRLKDALKDAAEAAKEKKLTEVDRLKAVQDVTRALADAATAESERTGKTDEASAAFARQLPTLADLAGKNSAAKDAVVGLGNSLGVTIKRTDDGKIAFDKLGQAVVTLPSGKTVKVDADTAKALAGLKDTKAKTEELKDKKLKVDADTKQAVGEVKKVKTGLDGLKGDAHKAGQDLGSGLTAGIRSMIGDAIAAAKSLASAALKGAKDLLGIKSPSTAMAEVGRWTVKGLIQGLESEQGAVKSTIERMVGQIKEAFKSQPDVAEGLIDFVRTGNKNLEALALQREALVQKLADAKEMAKRVAGSAQEWADITGMKPEDITGAGDMAAELRDKASAINNFANNINTLAKRGLNKKIIQDLIDAGVEKGATFAEMLVGSDGAEIKALNKAQAAVDKASKKLGKSSADAMYDVGKKSGDGYLKGLEESLKDLDKQMTKIVKALVAAIKRELKIKSPSQVMADIGVDTIAGWIVGIESMGGQAMASMQKVVGGALTKGSIPLDPTTSSVNPFAGGLRDVGDVSQHGYGQSPTATPTPGQPPVVVNMHDTVIREEADVKKVGSAFGFEYGLRAPANA